MDILEAEHVPGVVGHAHHLLVLNICPPHPKLLLITPAVWCTNITLLTADVSSLFLHYSALYFDDSLGACSVEWSSARMTRWGFLTRRRLQQDPAHSPVAADFWFRTSEVGRLVLCRCAGTCQYDRGGGCRIKLSEPLLKVGGRPPCLPDAQGSSCGLPVTQAHHHSCTAQTAKPFTCACAACSSAPCWSSKRQVPCLRTGLTGSLGVCSGKSHAAACCTKCNGAGKPPAWLVYGIWRHAEVPA